jgi:hypothetical protein
MTQQATHDDSPGPTGGRGSGVPSKVTSLLSVAAMSIG